MESFGFTPEGGLDLNTERLGWKGHSRAREQPGQRQCVLMSVCVGSSMGSVRAVGSPGN